MTSLSIETIRLLPVWGNGGDMGTFLRFTSYKRMGICPQLEQRIDDQEITNFFVFKFSSLSWVSKIKIFIFYEWQYVQDSSNYSQIFGLYFLKPLGCLNNTFVKWKYSFVANYNDYFPFIRTQFDSFLHCSSSFWSNIQRGELGHTMVFSM